MRECGMFRNALPSLIDHELSGQLGAPHEVYPVECLGLVAEAGGPVDHVEEAEDDGEDHEAGVVHPHQVHVPRRGTRFIERSNL